MEEAEAEARRLEAGFEKIREVVSKAQEDQAAAAAAAAATTTTTATTAQSVSKTDCSDNGVYKKKIKVAFLEWLEPLFNGGHWIPDLVRAAGAEYTMAEPGEGKEGTGDGVG